MTTTATADDTRAPLLVAIEELRVRDATPAVRIALAEAEFRLAIAAETEPAEAMDRLRAAIEQDPFCPKLFLHLGRLLHRSGRPVAALPEYRHAIRLAPASRRAHRMLALALLDMGAATRDLGDLVIAALNGGTPAELKAALAEVDAWLEEQAAPGTGGGRRPPRPAAAKPERPGAPDAWRISLYEQVTRGKLRPGRLPDLLAAGLARVADAGEVGEYATACVLLLAGGQGPQPVRQLGKSVLADHADHAAVVLLDAALRLAEAADPATFVELATGYLDRGALPPELVCWLHLAAYGPHQPGTAVAALALLDEYPAPIRELAAFRELKLAVLDGHALRAWAEERFAEARLLWQEAASIDRFRVPVALNLALLAARTRSAEDYGPAWERLSELLYLHAAGAGEVQLLLDDRRTLHFVLAQQAQLRHPVSGGSRDKQTVADLEAWLADTDALEEWLRQWDLYYVNARLGFRSPAHLLGVAADADAADREVAKDAFVRHVGLALRDRKWAGAAIFADLAIAQAEQAHVALTATETRDEYYESERPAARALAEEALNRGMTLRQMMVVLLEHPSAEQLRLGHALARRQLALPWKVLRQICVEQGMIADDLDIVKLFERDLVLLASYWDEPAAESREEYARRLSVLDDCVELLPHELYLRVLRCRALRAVDADADAYAAALTALELPAEDDDEIREQARRQLVDIVDVIGWEAIPEQVRKPADPSTAPTREVLVDALRRALEQFPRSGAVRRQLARLLVDSGDLGATSEAVALLDEGLASALNADQRAEFAERLAAIKSAAATVPIRASIRRLVEPAEEAARAAIGEYVRNSGGTTRKAALTAVRAAIDQVAEGRRMAEQAGLTDEIPALDDVLAGLREMAAQLAGEG